MTVQATARRVPFTGNGANTSFPFTFKCYGKTHLTVTKTVSGVDTLLVLDADYTVTLNSNQEVSPGGTVTCPKSGSPLANGVGLLVLGSAPVSQGTALTNAGAFFADTIEDMDDYATITEQEAREMLSRIPKIPATDNLNATDIPSKANRAGKFRAWDANGQEVASAGSGGGDTSLRTDLANGANGPGADLVAIKRTAAEIAAGVTPVQYFWPESALYRYGTNTTPGTTDMTTALQNAALVAAITGKITIPQDSIKTTAATALPSGCTVSGGGYLSNPIAATTNQTAIFTVGSGVSNVRIENLRFTGSDTSSATSNGNAIQTSDADHVKVDRCWFTLFRGPPVFFQGLSGTHYDCIVQGCYFFGNKTTSSAGEVNIYGTINGAQVLGCRFEASLTAPYGRGVFIANLSSTLNWTDLTVDDCYFKGYANNAVGTDDEDPSATFDCGIVKVTNCTILSIVQCGIKLKNSQRCIVTDNYLQDCDSVPEVAGSLQGTIYINACQDTVCSHNIIINAGTDGIRANGLNTAAGGTSAGAGRAQMAIDYNEIDGAGQTGVFITDDTYEGSISGNLIRGTTGSGISILPGSTKPALSLIVANNKVRGTGGNAAGIHAEYTTELTFNGNQVKFCGGYGIDITNCAEVVFTGNVVMDNGVGNVNTTGIKVTTASNVTVTGNRAGNSVATDQDYGFEIGGTVTGVVLTGNNFAGNQIADSLSVTQDAMIVGNWTMKNNNATAANIASKTNLVNTSGKFIGKQVFDTTNNRIMVATGTTDVSNWEVADGSAAVTPA